MTPLSRRPLLRRGWWWRVLVGAVGGYLVAFPLHDNYPGLYVLVIVLGVFLTIWLFVRSGQTPDQVLEQHHERELARTEDDSALLAELKEMFAKRACDWPALDNDFWWTNPDDTPCPACPHNLLYHEPVTKVCYVCHAPQG